MTERKFMSASCMVTCENERESSYLGVISSGASIVRLLAYHSATIYLNDKLFDGLGNLMCLMPLPTIFQLYRGGQLLLE